MIKCEGFTKAQWKADSKYKNDSSSFLFNFNKKNLFSNKNPNESIICDYIWYICFGNEKNSDYYIRNSFFKKKVFENTNNYCYNSNSYDVQEENNSEI